MRPIGRPHWLCAVLLAGLHACGGKPTAATSLGMETGDETATSDSSTSIGTSDTSDSSTSFEGCVDAGNFLTDDEDQVASNPGPPVIQPRPLSIPRDLGSGQSECDVFAQDCPEQEKCVPYASEGGTWDANECVPVQGDGMIGEPCTHSPIDATDDCDENSACWLVDEGMGTCTGFCSGSAGAPECPQGQYCLQFGGVVAFCVDGCNPLEQACPAGQACFWTGEVFGCTILAAEIPAGEPCGDFDDCGIGMICVDAASLPSCGGPSCCAEFCDLDCPDPCSQVGTSCVPLFAMGEAPLGEGDIGVCLAPG